MDSNSNKKLLCLGVLFVFLLSLIFMILYVNVINLSTKGLLISGGTNPDGSPTDSVEFFIPAAGWFRGETTCRIPSLSVATSGHTHNTKEDNSLVCGGDSAEKTCQVWTGKMWSRTSPLKQRRVDHMSWNTKDGVLLVGGGSNTGSEADSTELVSWNGLKSEEKFNLTSMHKFGCLVDDGESFIVIGGWQGFLVEGHVGVKRYDILGLVEEDLPNLHSERIGSGCSYFESGWGKNYLVTGGGFKDPTPTTEILYAKDPTRWIIYWMNLPAPLVGLVGANIDNVIYMTGGKSKGVHQSSVLRFDVDTLTWSVAGTLLDSRYSHAVSVVDIKHFKDACVE